MRWAIFALVAVLVSACSGVSTSSSGSGEPIPRRSASDLATVRAQAGIIDMTPTPRVATPTPTTPPMTPTPEPTPSDQNPGSATDETLAAALIVPTDVSSSWTLGNDTGLGVASFCDSPAIEEQFEALGWAYGGYSAAGGEWAEQWVVRLIEPDAQAAMEYVRTSLTCDVYTKERNIGDSVYWEFADASLPPLADDMHARSFQITYENPVYTPMVGNVVFVRKGEFVVVVLHYGFRADPATTEHLTQLAIARLDLIQDNAV